MPDNISGQSPYPTTYPTPPRTPRPRDLEDAVAKLSGIPPNGTTPGLIDIVAQRQAARRMPRETRVLAHDLEVAQQALKAERRAHGRTQATVYRLRCELAESRTLCLVDPSAYRALVARAGRTGELLANSLEVVNELRNRIKELEQGSDGGHADNNGELA